MNLKPRIETVLGFALIALFATISTAAAEGPGQAMAAVSAQLAVASGHAEALEEEINRQAPLTVPTGDSAAEAVPGAHDIGQGPKGGGHPAMPPRPAQKITRSMAAALDGLEAAVQEANALAGGNAALEPGMAHVLANVRRMRVNKALPADAASLGQEIIIELHALANNTRILEAEADLRAASAALGKKGRADAVRNHLEAAARMLAEAQNKGAYHLEDDIATLRVVLTRIKKGASPREAVTTDDVDELIGDIHGHLADLRGD